MQARYNEVRASSLRMLKSVSEFGNSSPSTASSLTTRQHSPRLSVVRASREKTRSASPKLNSFWNLSQSIVCIPISHTSVSCAPLYLHVLTWEGYTMYWAVCSTRQLVSWSQTYPAGSMRPLQDILRDQYNSGYFGWVWSVVIYPDPTLSHNTVCHAMRHIILYFVLCVLGG